MWVLALTAFTALPTSSPTFRPTTSGPLVAYTAHLTAAGHVLVQPLATAGLLRGTFGGDGQLAPLDAGRAFASNLSLFLEAGLTDHFTVGAQATAVFNHLSASMQSADYLGAGDTLLFTRGRFLFEPLAHPLSAALIFQVKLPSGNARAAPAVLGADLIGSGVVDLMAGLNLTRHVWPVVMHLDVLAIDALGRRAGDGAMWSLALELPLFDERLALMAEASGRHQVGDLATGPVDELVLGVGVEWIATDSTQLLLGFQRTVAGRNVPAADSVTLTVVPDFALWD